MASVGRPGHNSIVNTLRLPVVLAALALGGCGEDPSPVIDALRAQQAQYGWGPDKCPELPEGVDAGTLVDEQITNLVFKSCEGTEVALSEVCGADALWLVAAHAWCPHCQQLASFSESLHDRYAARGLASLHVLVEYDPDEAPDADDCSEWRARYEMDQVITLYDDTGASDPLFEQNFTALNVFVDRDRIIRNKIHSDIEGEIEAAIFETLPQ